MSDVTCNLLKSVFIAEFSSSYHMIIDIGQLHAYIVSDSCLHDCICYTQKYLGSIV